MTEVNLLSWKETQTTGRRERRDRALNRKKINEGGNEEDSARGGPR